MAAVLLEQGQGLHHRAVQIVVALEVQHLQQRWYDAAVVMAVGGACHQLHMTFVRSGGLGLTNQIVQDLLIDNRIDDILHPRRAAGSAEPASKEHRETNLQAG